MNRLPERLDLELDSFGFMALGAISVAERVSALATEGVVTSRPTVINQPLLLAMLGALSLSRTLRRRMEDSCPPGDIASHPRRSGLRGLRR